MLLIGAVHFGTEKSAANLFAKLLTERLNGGMYNADKNWKF